MREMSEIVETLFEMEGVSNVCTNIFKIQGASKKLPLVKIGRGKYYC